MERKGQYTAFVRKRMQGTANLPIANEPGKRQPDFSHARRNAGQNGTSHWPENQGQTKNRCHYNHSSADYHRHTKRHKIAANSPKTAKFSHSRPLQHPQNAQGYRQCKNLGCMVPSGKWSVSSLRRQPEKSERSPATTITSDACGAIFDGGILIRFSFLSFYLLYFPLLCALFGVQTRVFGSEMGVFGGKTHFFLQKSGYSRSPFR